MGRQCTGVATTGSRRTKVRRLAKHEPSKSTPLYSAEHDQKKSTQSSSSSSAITITIAPREAMPGSTAHADASLLRGTLVALVNQKGEKNDSRPRYIWTPNNTHENDPLNELTRTTGRRNNRTWMTIKGNEATGRTR